MVRLGVLGCGRIGRVHADSIDVHPRAELACVCDPFEDAAREVGARFGAEWGTDVDAVIGLLQSGEVGRDPSAARTRLLMQPDHPLGELGLDAVDRDLRTARG